jgi:hypothetical protein
MYLFISLVRLEVVARLRLRPIVEIARLRLRPRVEVVRLRLRPLVEVARFERLRPRLCPRVEVARLRFRHSSRNLPIRFCAVSSICFETIS